MVRLKIIKVRNKNLCQYAYHPLIFDVPLCLFLFSVIHFFLKIDNIHLNSIGTLYYKCCYGCSELTFTKQYDGDCQTTKQDGSKCDCDCDAE